MSNIDDCLLTPIEVSLLMAVPEPTLRDWRHKGYGPKWVRLSRKMIRYWRSDVLRFIAGECQ